jgi:glutamyl-tRNA synthetase
MRIEDLDAERRRPDAIREILDDFAWLGLEFDGAPLTQSSDLEPYRAAMRLLASQGRTYACNLTRAQIRQAASAPHADEQELRYPEHLRPADCAACSFERLDTNYRLIVPDREITIDDEFAGRSVHQPMHEVGDFVIWTRSGVPSYQLAVVVDDARQGVTDVVRGDDLLPSAARQVLLYEALGLPAPRWWHLPLVLDEQGRRLAKRNASMHVNMCRQRGVQPHRIVGLLAWWCGVSEQREEMSAEDFRRRFQLDRLSRNPIRTSRDDQEWLLCESRSL